MADIESNIHVNIDTSSALASIKLLQSQISAFHSQMARGGAAQVSAANQMQQSLINGINATGKFSASMQTIKTSTESFTTALEKNKLTMGEYFRYAGASTKSFGKLFAGEFETINKVARERVKDLQTQYIKMGRDANGAMKAIAVRPMALDMNDLGTKTAIAAQRQQILNQLLKQGSTNMLNFGKNTQWAGRQLMVGFSVPLMMVAGASIKAFTQMETEVVRFKRVYGDLNTTASDTNKALADIKQLAEGLTQYGVAVSDTMKMAADAAAMGKQGADLLQQVGSAAKLAILGGIDQQKALETTVSLTNAFGISTQDLSSKIDFLNSVENQTITNIDDLTTAIPKAAPVIKQLGGNVEDLTFFLTAMREGGVNAAEGANALKSGLASMINPTKAAKDMLAGFGISITGIVQKDKGNLKQTVIDLATALNKLDPLNRAQAIEKLFGKFQFSRISTLLQNVTAQDSQAAKVLQLSQASKAELAILSERELKKTADSPLYKFQKAIKDLQNALVPLGTEFAKMIVPVAKAVTDVLKKFNGLSENSKSFLTGFVGVVAGLGPIILMTFGLIANGVANVIKLFANIKSWINNTQNSSKTLGEQTQYMTEEQVKAAAVAASLEHAHNKLEQTFTSEAGAIEKLIQQYERATLAQRTFMGGPSTMPGRRMATGGMVVGPGGPTDDMVPTNLSNGEAVIDAATVKKNPRIIGALFAGKKINIPGYARNNSRSFNFVTPNIEAAFPGLSDLMHLKEASQSLGGVMGKIVTLAKTLTDVVGSTPGTSSITGANAAHGNARMILTEAEAQAIGRGMIAAGETGRTAQKLANAKKYGTEDITAFSNLVFPMPRAANLGEIGGKDLAQWVRQDPARFTSMIAKNANLDANDPGLIKFANDVASEMERAGSKAITESDFEKIIQTTIEKQVEGAAKGALVSARDTYSTFNVTDDPTKRAKREPAAKGVAMMADGQVKTNLATRSYIRVRQSMKEWATFDKEANTFIKGIVLKMIDGIKKATKQASPSKEARTAGENIGKGSIQGIQSAVDDAKAAGTQLAEAAVSQARSDAAKRGWETRRANQAAMAEEEAMASGTPSGKIPWWKRAASSARGMVSGGLGASMAISMIPSAMAMSGNKQLANIGNQLMGPAMAASSALMMLPGPIGGVVAGLIGLVTIVGMVNAAKEKENKAALNLGKAMAATQEKVVKFSEITKTVSATEARQKAQTTLLAGLGKTGSSSFGDKFLTANIGKQIMKDLQSQQVAGKSSSSISQNLFQQLGYQVAQGTITSDQAKSIAQSIGDKLKDQNITATVVGQINDLFGPNGENLFKDPLTVTVRLQQAGQNQSQQTIDTSKYTTETASKAVTNAIAMGGYQASNPIADAISKIFTGKTTQESLTNQLIGQINPEKMADAKAAMQTQIQSYGANQGNLDIINKQYDKLVAQAKTQKEINDLERQRQDALTQQIDQNNKMFGQMQKARALLNASGGNYDTDIFKTAFTDKMKGTAWESKSNDLADKINSIKDKTLKLRIQGEAISGDLDPQFINRIASLSENETFKQNYLAKIKTFGDAKTIGLVTGLISAGAKDNTITTILEMKVTDPNDIIGALETLKQVTSVNGVTIDINSNAGQAAIKEYATDIEQLRKDSEKGPITHNMIVKASGSDKLAKIIEDSAVFKSLPKEQQIQFIAEYDAILNLKGDKNMIEAWKKWANGDASKTFEQYAAYLAGSSVKASNTSTGGNTGGNTQQQGAATPQTSALDALVIKLKEVQKNQLKVTEGWNASMKALRGMSSGNLSGLSGISQDLMNIKKGTKASGSLIDFIIGMDPKEYEKQKKNLFKFDNKGNIVALKRDAKVIQNALAAIAMGDFQTKMKRGLTDLQYQQKAVSRLTSAGLSGKQAFDLAADAQFAYAIATAKSSKEVQILIDLQNKLTKQTELYTAQQEAANTASQLAAVQLQNEAIAAAVAAGATKEQVAALKEYAYLSIILKSDNFNFNAADFQKALQDAVDLQAAQTQLSISPEVTVEPQLNLQQQFGNIMSSVQQYFSAKKAMIEIRYKASERAQQDIIDAAQAGIDKAQTVIDAAQTRIDGIQDRIDLYNRDLDKIQEQEDAINKSYEAQSKALNEIKTLNDRIAQQDKARLTIADALTQGDISAAAKAAQDMRQQDAQNAMDDQQKALDAAKQNALDKITVNGKTRAQIEATIKDLNEQIYQIQKNIIKPQEDYIKGQEKIIKAANDQIAALEKQKAAEEASLTLLGMTEEQWLAIQAGVDEAFVSSEEFRKSIEKALAALKDIPGALELLKGLGLDISAYVNPISGSSGTSSGSGSTGGSTGGFTGGGLYSGGGVGRPSMLLMSSGGMVMPKYFAAGGYSKGTDIIPAMLAPGEFVVKKYAVDAFGADKLHGINAGNIRREDLDKDSTENRSAVYNSYELNVHVKSDADPDMIARTVMTKIKEVDSQRLRGNKY